MVLIGLQTELGSICGFTLNPKPLLSKTSGRSIEFLPENEAMSPKPGAGSGFSVLERASKQVHGRSARCDV